MLKQPSKSEEAKQEALQRIHLNSFLFKSTKKDY